MCSGPATLTATVSREGWTAWSRVRWVVMAGNECGELNGVIKAREVCALSGEPRGGLGGGACQQLLGRVVGSFAAVLHGEAQFVTCSPLPPVNLVM